MILYEAAEKINLAYVSYESHHTITFIQKKKELSKPVSTERKTRPPRCLSLPYRLAEGGREK